MNPDSTRKAIRRSILKQEGARRVEFVLTGTEADALDELAVRCGSQAAAVRHALLTSVALVSARAWLARWAVHVGGCRGGEQCTCGLTRIRWELEPETR